MKKMKSHKNQEGFTLIELMIALVILGIGIFAMVALQTRTTTFNNGSKKQSEGYTWAMDQIETLYTVAYDDDGAAGLLRIQGDPAVIGDGITLAQGPYTVEWDVENNGAGGLNNIDNSKRIHVSVRWNTNEVAQVDFTRVESSF